MSDSVQPHRRQPTRLRCPWDSPGKNTGVGCHFLLWCMKVKSESEVTESCPALSDPMDCSLPGSCIHGSFQTRVLEWGAKRPPNELTHLWVIAIDIYCIINLKSQVKEYIYQFILKLNSLYININIVFLRIINLFSKTKLASQEDWYCFIILQKSSMSGLIEDN